MLVLVVCLCPSSVRVVATFPGTVLFPLLCSVLQFLFFSVQAILMFFVNNALKLKYEPGHLKVNLWNVMTCTPFRTVNFEIRSQQTTVTQ